MNQDPDSGKEIEVDPERGAKWIRIRPNAVGLGGSGSATLVKSPLLLHIEVLYKSRSVCAFISSFFENTISNSTDLLDLSKT